MSRLVRGWDVRVDIEVPGSRTALGQGIEVMRTYDMRRGVTTFWARRVGPADGPRVKLGEVSDGDWVRWVNSDAVSVDWPAVVAELDRLRLPEV